MLPILDRLDIIDDPDSVVPGLSSVQPQDMIPVVHEYVIGSGDAILVTVFELINPNTDASFIRPVDELGMIRLPVIGPVEAQGFTPSELEKKIKQILNVKGVLRDATVSVTLQTSQQNTFSVIGEPTTTNTTNAR